MPQQVLLPNGNSKLNEAPIDADAKQSPTDEIRAEAAKQQQQQQESTFPEHFNEQPTTIGQQHRLANSTPPSAAIINGTSKTTKLNGLKNRIIQRPPPLILDKVSNFYDNNDSTSTTTSANPTIIGNLNSENQTVITNQQLATNQANYHNINILKQVGHSNSDSTNTQQLTSTTNPNHKFWASLNQNAASRSKSSNNQVTSRSSLDDTLNQPALTDSINSPNSLGADLIITHRNSTIIPPNKNSSAIYQRVVKNSNLEAKQEQINLNDSAGSRVLDTSNNSEFDEFGASDNGGNLIGVDNPTSPAPDSARLMTVSDNAVEFNPTGASSSSSISTRPRSNNPFLEMDDDAELTSIMERNDNHDLDDQNKTNNFHKRPASFIAATDATSFMNNRKQQQSNVFNLSDNNLSGALPDQLQNLQLDSQSSSQQQMLHLNQANATSSLYDERDATSLDQQQNAHILNQLSNSMGSIYNKAQPVKQVQNREQPQEQHAIYGVYGGSQNNGKFSNFEQQTINVDSESAVSKLPPAATMQLPNWSDAIYQLNNAILDTNSVAGGAENGQFIYIIESGDIILELDGVKVSGFTLVEFNELLELKSIHLLSAVQTRYSCGLTIDLKQFLSCSFSKNSMDKDLQDLIRENIYRKTIPCTTRPPRDGEVDKVDYHFLTKEQFVEMNNRVMLLECGIYGGHYYGTMRPFSDLNNLTIYGSLRRKEISQNILQPFNSNHPAISAYTTEKDIKLSNPTISISQQVAQTVLETPLYENHESLRMYQMQSENSEFQQPSRLMSDNPADNNSVQLNHRALPPILDNDSVKQSSIVAVDSEALPYGWERVIDQTHGTYYIDHNTQKTQYERPYEIELTKGAMGFGFTLVEADDGILLVRSVIPGGPAHQNGMIRPGDILVSAVGVSVASLQHTDIARLFSTFAVGDRIRLVFARSNYLVDANFVPDEYLFSNGTNGDLAIAVNSNYFNQFNQTTNTSIYSQNLASQDYDFLTITLRKGDQGFGFKISDSEFGQKVREITNSEICTGLQQGDSLLSVKGLDITKMNHQEVVELLKNYPSGQDIDIAIKRRKRFRSKTPMAMHSEIGEYSMGHAPLRNCKTPNFEGLVLNRYNNMDSKIEDLYSQRPMPNIDDQQCNTATMTSLPPIMDKPMIVNNVPISINQSMIQTNQSDQIGLQSIYGVTQSIPNNNELYYNNSQINLQKLPVNVRSNPSNLEGEFENMTNSHHPSQDSSPQTKIANINGLKQMNQFNNFMYNDKLVMMQMQQAKYHQNSIMQQSQPTLPQQSIYSHAANINATSDYQQMPLYSNSDMIRAEVPQIPLPMKQTTPYIPDTHYDPNNFSNNFYANNEELVSQGLHYTNLDNNSSSYIQPKVSSANSIYGNNQTSMENNYLENAIDDYEEHTIDLDRGNTESNWGIRLIGGSEVGRAITIGSIIFGGAAAKNGQLKSGDEILSINGIDVVGATHQNVVELISACLNRATLRVRRKKFADSCEVVLNRNMDEGFGFVIISSGNCALIGKIMQGSPADRCQQLHVRDRIIAVNGRLITPNMQHPEIVNMIKKCGSELRLLIIPANSYAVELIKNAQNDNFGFGIRGGSEYDGTPLYILRVAPNGLARDSLNVGDQIIEINGYSTVGMTHQQAANIIKYSPIVKLKLRRNYVTPSSLLANSPRALQRCNQVTAEMKTVNQISGPNFFQDGSMMSSLPEHGIEGTSTSQLDMMPSMTDNSSMQQQSQPSQQPVIDQQAEAQEQEGANGLVFNQSMQPLYAS